MKIDFHSLVTGTVALTFSAIGVLSSGFIISRYKPRARYMAAWNIIVGAITVMGMLSYTMLGCPDNERGVVNNYGTRYDIFIRKFNSFCKYFVNKNMDFQNCRTSNVTTCNSNCDCDVVKYSPVCGEDGNSYFSGCHAGCTELTSGHPNRVSIKLQICSFSKNTQFN